MLQIVRPNRPFSLGERLSSRSLPTLVVVLALTTVPNAALSSGLTFTTRCFTNHITPAVATGDFNSDGRIDIVVSPAQPGLTPASAVEVFLGNGDGTFRGPLTLNTGNGVFDIVAADLDRDGILDIATANIFNSTVSVLRGRGDGTFKSMSNFGAGKNPNGLAVGDLNRDGKMDMAVSSESDAVVSVLLGTGQGGAFKSPVRYATAFPTRAVAIADLNGDGRLDLVTADAAADGPLGNNLSVLLGNGDGTLQPHREVLLPKFTGRRIVAADFDRDGKPDLVLGTQGDGDSGVLTLHGNGDGTFGTPVYYLLAHADFSPTLNLAVGNVNGDELLDIVGANSVFSRTVSILLGNGDGTFATGGDISVDFGRGVAIGDFNGDGMGDIVTDDCVQLNVGSGQDALIRSARADQPEATRVSALGITPNPLRRDGTLRFALPAAGKAGVYLYDIGGRQVRTLMQPTWLEAGLHTLRVDRSDSGLKTGIYFYRVVSDAGMATGRIVVMDE